MKNIIKITLFVAFVILLNFSLAYAGVDKIKNKITLEMIQAYDPRLPILSKKDIKEIIDEAKRVISLKFSENIEITIHDNGVVSLDKLFKDEKYPDLTGKNAHFENPMIKYKYDIDLGESAPMFKDREFKKIVIEFLKQWSLKSLKGYFPDRKINNYDDVFDNLMTTYHQKIKWLKTLKTGNGESLVKEPLPPYQSLVEWYNFMWVQDKYDLIFTNTLIVYDNASMPYPHAICKHAKAGGLATDSPNREALDGKSILVNILEDYGNIKGISSAVSEIENETKNNKLGGYYLAHEFGHAFYWIPDVYDHGDKCVMNSSLSAFDYLKGYNAVISDLSRCSKCQPWIIAKELVLQADEANRKGRSLEASKLYLEAIEKTPKIVDGDYEHYIESLYDKSRDAFKKIK